MVDVIVSPNSFIGEIPYSIVYNIRIPRAILGLLVGSILAASGAGLQGMFKNPLVDTGMLGVTVGATFDSCLRFLNEDPWERLRKLKAAMSDTKMQIRQTLHDVTQIGKKCHGSDCAVMQQIGDCIMPREGIFTIVLKGGVVRPGDEITIVE